MESTSPRGWRVSPNRAGSASRTRSGKDAKALLHRLGNWTMRCTKCGSDNGEGRKFCAKCGVALARQCPGCGASNEPGEDFCGECGAGLATSVMAAAASSAQAAAMA